MDKINLTDYFNSEHFSLEKYANKFIKPCQ